MPTPGPDVQTPSLGNHNESTPHSLNSSPSPVNITTSAHSDMTTPTSTFWPPSTSSSQSQHSENHVPSQEDQVGQYNDDIALHTQMQLQLYLEDLEEAESLAQVDEAIVASLYTANPLDPIGSNSFTTPTDATLSDMTPELMAQSFQQQMISLATTNTSQSFPMGVNVNLLQDGLGLEHGALHDFQDEMDDGDDECLPPSETKYILYDDHVSPITIREALVILNGTVYDDLGIGTTRGENRSHLPHTHLVHDGENPIYSTSSFQRDAVNTHAANKGKPRSMTFNEYDDDDDNDYNFHTQQYQTADDKNSQEAFQGHSSTLGLLSPPIGTKSDYLDQEDLKEETLQGRPSHHGGPDISLNLAGNMISPITIHELFFSRFYSRLVYLNLWDTNLGIWGAQAVGGLMADNACRIQYLNLGCNRLGFEGIVQLAGLYKNSSLVELDLRDNRLGPKSVHYLQQTMVRLKKNKACNIRRLNLSNNKINDVGCISIAKIIMGTALTHLDLSFNSISDWGASTILAAFESNDLSLRDINLEANPLSFAGGVDICKILALPRSRITHLDLRGAKVTDVGVPYLAEALKSHQCPIVYLNLYDCQLTDTGILKLAIKLSVNKSLRALGLGSNCIGDMGILALSQGLCLNNTLEELDLSENDLALSRAGLEALISAMRTNTSLLYLNLDVDGHPHAVSRSLNDTGEANVGFESYTTYQHPQTHYHQQHQQQNHEPFQPSENLAEAIANINPLELLAPTETENHVGEVMAPTHAALTLSPSLHDTLQPSIQDQLHHQHHPQAVYPQGGVGVGAPVHNERNLEQERRQLLIALATLKTYVRHNYKRTTRMHSLCFEILVTARVLMFAKDAAVFTLPLPSSPSFPLQSQNRDESKNEAKGIIESPSLELCQNILPPTIPMQFGLPTPPLKETETETEFGTRPILQGIDGGDLEPMVTSPGPRGTLADLPWEIKEMILRSLDREGLLSERQFQAIMSYCASNWETVRKPWDRWGEIRETILENTR
ncbi:NACHT, LRR and PYD domains-containing protein 14, partial [Entomortierella lignicola]